MDSRRLLLIYDSEIALAYSESLLTDAGFEVRAVSSLQAFQAVLADWKPHLIVTDLYMPEMNGAELVRWVRTGLNSDMPIVVITTMGEVKDRERGMELGANGYLTKPVNQAELIKTVCKYLGGYKF